jgi:translation initiation factor IF-2
MEEPILLIKEPIVIKALARQMGLRPPQIMKDLMELNIFTNINNTISRDVAASVLKKHGRKFAFLD